MPTPSALRPARAAILLALLLVPSALAAQTVTGRVVSPEGPVAGADVYLYPAPRGRADEVEVGGRSPAASTVSGRNGAFVVARLEPGRYLLLVQSLGYSEGRRVVEVVRGDPLRIDVRVAAAAVAMDPLVVTGTLRETRVSDSPVKVDVVSARLLERNGGRTLMDAIQTVNGLYTQVDCGVCYTNNIRINGMEGPYTAVLIDGMPIMGALASVYGLNGIDPSIIERLEILKGPQSTLYGTEAMGGVVNVITKDPRFTPRWSVQASRSTLGENEIGASLSPGDGRTLLSGTLVHDDAFVDDNGDGFSDTTLDTRVSLFGKRSFYREGERVAGITAKLYGEDRFGGREGWTEADRGSREVYGESIRTRRAEVLADARLPWEGVRAAGSYAVHDQSSWYGDEPYDATQHVGYAHLLWEPRGTGAHDLLLGASLRVDAYDDDTPATPSTDVDVIPGLFVQDGLAVGSVWTLMGGVRLDHHEDHGVIAAPRANVKWEATDATTLRLNAGTGFRVVNLFTEDHAALTGAREVVVEEALDPERSWSVAVNANHIVDFHGNNMMVDLDLFHTRFGNKIIPDYDVDPDRIVYRNLPGHSVSRGFSFALNQNFEAADLPLFYTLGLTVQDVYSETEGVREEEFFAADWQGVWTVSYTVAGRLALDWSGTVVGPMRLPEYDPPFQRPTRSRGYDLHNLRAAWRFEGGGEAFVSVRNVFDFTQGSPLVDPANPFGEDFDTAYVWGPVVGRTLTVGLRLAGSR